MRMLAAVWLMLSSLLYSLQLSTGSFPRPLTPQEEQCYLKLSAHGDMEARNILIERNLRLVAHIMKKNWITSERWSSSLLFVLLFLTTSKGMDLPPLGQQGANFFSC